MHKVADHITREVGDAFVHIAEPTAPAIHAKWLSMAWTDPQQSSHISLSHRQPRRGLSGELQEFRSEAAAAAQ